MFSDFPEQIKVTQLLQRSLERDRLAHAYLFAGNSLKELEDMARTLAKAVNCLSPPRRASHGLSLDSCDACDPCRRIDRFNHPDVLWIRPESRTRGGVQSGHHCGGRPLDHAGLQRFSENA